MQELDKILEEMREIKDGNRKENLYAKYPPNGKDQEVLNAYSQGYEDGTDDFYNAVVDIIRKHMTNDPAGKAPKVENILDKIEAEHPYKVPGNHNTYSQYNEGWQDAIDRVRGELESLNSGWIPVEDERLWNILFEEACVEGEQERRIYNRLKETFGGERSDMDGKL